jgi:hypothetical protein
MSKLRRRYDSNNTKYIDGKLYIQCKTCEEYKLADSANFLERPETTFGFRSSCKPCFRAERAKKRATEEGKEANKKYRLKSSFGITLDEFNELKEQQDNECPICNRKESEFFSKTTSGKVKGFVVDHNHETGEVRGLLCSECNVGLGFLQDSPEVLQRAILYLTERGFYGKPV